MWFRSSKISNFILSLCLAAFVIKAVGAPVVVMYPDVREPYSGIFKDIVGGIEQQSENRVATYSLKKGEDLESVRNWLQKKKPKAIILLGNQGKYLAGKLYDEYVTVTGATILSNKNVADGLSGISLSPAPEKLFAKLRELSPSVERVTVVYHPEVNGWLVELARSAAKSGGFELVALPAKDVRDAANVYRQVLESQNNSKDAIWLLQGDPTLDERSLLPTILNSAWSSYSVVFSSNPSHVKRGALFSLFPDNYGMGKSLAVKALTLANGGVGGAEPLNDLLMAINVRTAEHLNLKLERTNEKDFDLVFPSR